MDTPHPSAATSGDTLPSDSPAFPTPAEIVAALDRTVFGQDEAKRCVAIAVYKHFLGLAANTQDGLAPAFGHQHVLIEGPTGSGKSHLIRELARFLGVPVAFCPATRLVETGYVGEQVESVVRALLNVAGGDRARAARGIIVLDEIDKLRVANMDTRDVSGRGVQNGLLTLLDGVRVPIQRDDQTKTLDTSGILFIATGAFVGLDAIARARSTGVTRLGFGAVDAPVEVLPTHTTEDFVAFGLIPELMGRFRHLCRLQPLSVDELVDLALDVEQSALRRLQDSFAAHGVQLEFSRGALRQIARRAAAMETGSRALDRALAETVARVEWRVLSGELHGCRVRFDQPAVLGGEPRIRRLDTAPEANAGELRRRIGQQVPQRPAAPQQITDTRGWTDSMLATRVRELRPLLEVESAPLGAKVWWNIVEREHQTRLGVVLRLIEELVLRNMKLAEFHRAFSLSNTTNMQANLHFADYLRLKLDEEERRGRNGAE